MGYAWMEHDAEAEGRRRRLAQAQPREWKRLAWLGAALVLSIIMWLMVIGLGRLVWWCYAR